MTTPAPENIEEMSQNQRILICLQVLDIFKRLSKEKTQEEISLIMDFLNGFSPIKEVSKDFQDQPSFLAKCANNFEYHCFKRGDLIADKGSQSENFIIILKGKTNIYEPKTSKEFKKIKSLQTENSPKRLTRMQSKKFTRFHEDHKANGNESPTRLFSRTSLDLESATQKESMWEFPTQKSMKKRSRDLIRESSDNLEVSDNFHRMSMSSKVSFHLDKKPSEDIQVSFDNEEQLIFKNPFLKSKYFEGDVCILRFTKSLTFGAVINERCFQQNYRSLNVLVAAEDTHVIRMSRDSFTQVFQEELESRRQKKKYFTYFFDDIPDFPKILYNYIREKTYVINDKIFDQEDEADGLYFIKSGEVKFSTAQFALKTQESEAPEKRTGPSPLRKEVVGAEWLTTRRKTSPDDRENLFGFKASHRKTSAILGTLGGYNSFGEEGFFTDDRKRAYTASAATNKLELYFLGWEYFSTVRVLHPQIVRILEHKAKSLNSWLLKRTQDIKGVQSIVGQIFDNPSQAKFMRSRRGNSNLLRADYSGRLTLSNPTQPRLVISNSMRKNFLAKRFDLNLNVAEEPEKSPQSEKLSLASRNRLKKPRIKSENRLFSNPGTPTAGSRKQRNQASNSPSPPPPEKKGFSLIQRFRRKHHQNQILEPISPIKKGPVLPESPELCEKSIEDSVEATLRYKLSNPAYFHETTEVSFQRPSVNHRVALPTYEYIGLSERSFSHRNSLENISLDQNKDFINYHLKQQFNQAKTPPREPHDPLVTNSDSLSKKKTFSRSVHHMFRLKPRHNSNVFSHMYRDTSPS